MLKVKTKQKEALVDELMYSNLPASQIVSVHANEQKQKQLEEAAEKRLKEKQPVSKLKHFSSGVQIGRGTNVFGSIPLSKPIEGEPYQYEKQIIDLDGPNVPEFHDLEGDGYLLHVKAPDLSEKAGGFLSQYPCYRALQEGFSGLYFNVE